MAATFSVLTFLTSSYMLTNGVHDMGFNISEVTLGDCPTEKMEAKAAEISKALNTKFSADEYGYISTIISNEEGSLGIEFGVDGDGEISNCSIRMLNMSSNEELNKKAEECIKYAIGLSASTERASKVLSEYISKIKSDEFLKSEEYKIQIEDQSFCFDAEITPDEFTNFTTLDPRNPERVFEFYMCY